MSVSFIHATTYLSMRRKRKRGKVHFKVAHNFDKCQSSVNAMLIIEIFCCWFQSMEGERMPLLSSTPSLLLGLCQTKRSVRLVLLPLHLIPFLITSHYLLERRWQRKERVWQLVCSETFILALSLAHNNNNWGENGDENVSEWQDRNFRLSQQLQQLSPPLPIQVVVGQSFLLALHSELKSHLDFHFLCNNFSSCGYELHKLAAGLNAVVVSARQQWHIFEEFSGHLN